MPARGDHEQRRREVARIAADLVAAGGLAAATHRRIAEAGGCSTTIVSHYFTDRRDLVTAVYREVGERVAARLDAAMASAGGLSSVLAALLPLDADRARDWRLLFAFLGQAATDADLTAEQRTRAATARARITQAVAAGQRSGQLRADLDLDDTGRILLALVLGIGMQALFDPEGWPEERVMSTLDRAIEDLRRATRDR